ncbi:MAG: hypothetical protein GXP40_03160, partial [Chloroflexi bacterium]|nr:hypothetical protein [Chloroflexota bacterium]
TVAAVSTQSALTPTAVPETQAPAAPTVAPAASPAPTEIPFPPPAVSPGGSYQLKEERLLGAYAVRYWHDPNSDFGFDDIVLIERAGMQSIRIETASAIEPLTGSDLNGDGYPEVIIETYSGGAHCCFGTQVYSLGATPVLILQKPESNAGGQFQDLDGDGVYEFVTYDDLFAYQYCPYAVSPFVKVIMAYDPAQARYLPASPRFGGEYLDEVAQAAVQAENAQPGDFGEWDGTTKCAVLPLVMDYLYTGQAEKAHSELLRVYPFPDAESFWDEVYQQVQASPLYTP